MLIWHGIVRNESKIINRCIDSLINHVDGAIVADTGSTDGTPELIRQAFASAGKPVEVHEGIPFENFSQARNKALELARCSDLQWDWAVLVDADMALVVEKSDWLKAANGGLAYDMEQRAGNLVYSNRRLVNRKATGEYMGVTHEYLNIQSAGSVAGAWLSDSADGANRPDKLQRDVALLEEALDKETNPGLLQRYHFYLANSYFDLGNWERASIHYKRRVEMGGWDEERWYAQFRYAHCLGRMGDHAGFVWNMLAAYEMRPQRAENLHALAKYFREHGHGNFRSLLFSEVGLLQQRPTDQLFVDDYVYASGLREEFAICAYYDERRRRTGAKEANKLALAGSEQARHNLFWYLKPLADGVPSFKPMKIPFQPPEGWVAMNPSVINRKGKPLILVRTVNYAITSEGRYVIRADPAAPVIINTRNWLVRLGPDDTVASSMMLHMPENWPKSKFDLVLGFEDSRLFEWYGELWTISTVRELNSEGWCEQVLSRIDAGETHNWKQILPKDRRHEKNWMPWIKDGELQLVYRLGTLVNTKGEVIAQHNVGLDVSHISGGSQVINLDERTNLALVHEARNIPGRVNRYYQHRFVVFRKNGMVDRISQPFFFHDRQIEFVAGLAYFQPDKLMISYGIRDEEAWLATMDLDEVVRFIYGDAL